MKEFMLYNNFLNTELYTSTKGDGGNDIYTEILRYIENINDKSVLNKIKDELLIWLEIGRSSYFIMAINLIGDLKLMEFKDELIKIKIKIIKKHISDFPDYFIDFIDNALKKMN